MARYHTIGLQLYNDRSAHNGRSACRSSTEFASPQFLSNVVMHRRLGRRQHRCVFLASYYLYHAFILYILLSLSNRHQTSSRFSFSYILHTPFRLTGACPGLQSGHFSLRLHPLNNLFIHNRASPFIYLQPRITTLLFILIAQLDMTSLTNSDKTPNF